MEKNTFYQLKKHQKTNDSNEVEASLYRLLNSGFNSIIIVDKNGLIKYVNLQTELLFQRTAEELIGSEFGFPINEGISELEILQKDGNLTVVEMQHSNIDWMGESCHYISLYDSYMINIKQEKLNKLKKDIRLMEMQIRNKQKLESIGELASGVAHEINNPLNGILNYGQVILDIIKDNNENFEQYKEDIAEFSAEIVKESNRISKIVKGLLQFSRSEDQSLAREDIEEIVNSTLSILSLSLKKDQIEVEIKLDKNLPMIECRPQQIQQVLMNLIVNAKYAVNKKYTDFDYNKKIEIKVRNIKVNNQLGIRIIVEDNGIGIPENIQEKVFDPFFTTKGRTEGTGIGLSICYKIIKEHNGELYFKSEEGKYSKFIIDLPCDNG